jgi:hypothetical protein
MKQISYLKGSRAYRTPPPRRASPSRTGKESRIKIGGVLTRWTRPVARDAIPHRSIRTGPLPRLAIYDEPSQSVALYELAAPRDWRRLLFTSDPAEMLAALPKRITDA